MRRKFVTTGSVALFALSFTFGCASADDDGIPRGNGLMYGTGSWFGMMGDAAGWPPGNGGAPNTAGWPGAGGFANVAGMQGAGGIVGQSGAFSTGGFVGNAGAFNTGGVIGVAGSFNTGGFIGGGTGGDPIPPGTGGADTGTGGSTGGGTCCSSGDCLCHGPAPTALTDANGPYKTANFTIPAGTVHYPTDAEPPLAGLSLCAGFLNTGPEMAPWGPFYASHGIVVVITTTTGADLPDLRATKLLDAVTQLKAENTKNGSPLFGKMAGRYGTSGYSMGGGGTSIASTKDPTLRTSIGIAPWGGVAGVGIAALELCGSADTVAPCSMSQTVYNGATKDKMMITIQGVSHLQWFPPSAGGGTSGKYALAFQKVYLEGDERWKPLLVQKPTNGTMVTNIQ